MWRTAEERDEWAEDHGYSRYCCREHGTFWSDSGAHCERCPEPPRVIHCCVCKRAIRRDEDGFLERCARISRGDFRFEDDHEDHDASNIKFERFVCEKCFLEDEDLCRFFNKLGMNIR